MMIGDRDAWDVAQKLVTQAVNAEYRMAAAVAAQPAPVPQVDRPSIHDLVAEDLAERKALGRQRYGTTLQAGNGRDALVDAYQEALDLACYLRQAIEERGKP